MSEHDDDPLVRALRSPGTPDELAGEGAAVQAFRASFATRRSRRARGGRLGLGGGALAISLALGGGGVAAAYTQTLPDPVQDLAHDVLGPVGVPAPPPPPPPAADRAVVPAGPDTASAPTSSPPDGTTSPDPGATRTEPDGRPSPADPSGRSSPSESPRTAAPTDEPTAPVPTTPPTVEPTEPVTEPVTEPTEPPPTDPDPEPEPEPRPKPAAVSVAVTDTRVAPGATVSVAGTVTDAEGAVVADRRVRLRYRVAGGTWTTYADARTSPDGTVSFDAVVGENVAYRLLVKRRVASTRVRVLVEPALTVAVDGRTISLTATGGFEGDTVLVARRTRDGLEVVGTTTLDAAGAASYEVEERRRDVRYAVRLVRTPRHLAAGERVVVAAG